MDEATKARIDGMTYEQMLTLYRRRPQADAALRHAEELEYFKKKMSEKKAALSEDEIRTIQARVGWST